MKKMFLLSATFVALTCYCFAQTKGLKVGEQVPNYTFTDLINYPKKTVTINELKGKYIILDFWFIHCTSCIAAFPHLNELQNKFKDKLQIILVNRVDKVEAIKTFFPPFKKKSGINLNLVAQCGNPELLYKYFPNGSNPHEVVIDPNGKVYAITDAESLTTENIGAILDGKQIDFPLKDDFLDKNLPLVVNFNPISNKGILVNSSLLGYFNANISASKSNEKGELIGVTETNRTLIDLYRKAYPAVFENISGTQIIYETNDSIFQNTEGDHTKLFSYDIIAPPGTLTWTPTDKNFQQFLGQDLDRAFNFSLRREKRQVDCVIVKTNSAIGTSVSRYAVDDYNLQYIPGSAKNNLAIYMHKSRLVAIPYLLYSTNNAAFTKQKMIVEATEPKEFDLDFPIGFDFSNTEALISFLHQKGIDISFENRELDCVVISDKKPGEPTVLTK